MNSGKTPSTMRLGIALLPILVSTLGAVAQQTVPAKPQATSQTTPKPAATAQPWTKIPIPPLHPFRPVQPRRIELSNGLVLFLQEDHELPFINGNILIRGGSRDEPEAKVGLVSIYGETWRTSGTATVDGDKLDDQLEAKAASVETSGGTASTSVTWSSLKDDFDSVFAATMDLLLHPTSSSSQKARPRPRSPAATTAPTESPSARP